ncbi:MAG: hypothetical protein JKY22_00625 [Flavobacteriaceae bacterium]|nr:hypothetical protein [Flavobacteriaceae bacterium]
MEIPNAKRALFEFGVLQNMAANHLAARKFINIDFLKTQSIQWQNNEIPKKISDCLQNDPIHKNDWFKLIVDEIPLLDIRGKNGLKFRSGLMEFRYDLEMENT